MDIFVRKYGGLGVTTTTTITTTTSTTTTTGAAAALQTSTTVGFKLNTKKATFRHRLAHHNVKFGSIK